MLRQAPRIITRLRTPIIHSAPSRRLLSTAPPTQTSRSWKNSAARWGIAVGLIYWYSNSNLFAEEAAFPVSQPLSPTEETNLPTIDAITETRAQQRRKESEQKGQRANTTDATAADTPTASNSPAESEEEASSEGAFNEETGEINWDCPCLGGMAHGTCGEEFKAAFSCFVYSTDEPKGMDCVDKFQGMQDCFRAHPEEYGDELEREEEDAKTEAELEMREREGGGTTKARDVEAREGVHAPASVAEEGAKPEAEQSSPTLTTGPDLKPSDQATHSKVEENSGQTSAVGKSQNVEGQDPKERAQKAKAQVGKDHAEPTSESDSLVPKASHDAR